MSLIAWYPLNGNLNNYGVGDMDLTVSANPSYTNSILGKGLSGGGAAYWTAEQTSRVLNNNAVSICFWIKVTSTESRAMIFGKEGMSSTTDNRKFSIFQYPTANDLYLSWQNEVANSPTFMNCIEEGVFPTNTWTHCAITYGDSTVKIYINGSLYKTYTGKVSASPSFANQTQVLRSCSDRIMNDYRFYDHCLSAKEVHEIAKALVAHFPMNQTDYGSVIGRNLLTMSNNIPRTINDYQGLVTTSVNSDSTTRCGYNRSITFPSENGTTSTNYNVYLHGVDRDASCEIQNNLTYTFSFYVKADKALNNYQFNYEYINATTTVNVTTEWTRVVLTGVATGKYSANYVCLGKANRDKVNGSTLYVSDYKLEIGSFATPWSPPVSWGEPEQDNLFKTPMNVSDITGGGALTVTKTTNGFSYKRNTAGAYNIRLRDLGFNGIDGPYTFSADMWTDDTTTPKVAIDITDMGQKIITLTTYPRRVFVTADVWQYNTQDNYNGFVGFYGTTLSVGKAIYVDNIRIEHGYGNDAIVPDVSGYGYHGHVGSYPINLLPNSSNFSGWGKHSTVSISGNVATYATTDTLSWRALSTLPNLPMSHYLNKYLTISVDVRSDSPSDISNVHITFEARTSQNSSTRGYYRTKSFSGITDKWQRISYTLLINETNLNSVQNSSIAFSDCAYLGINFYNYNLATLQYRNPKLEIGRKPSGYIASKEIVANYPIWDEDSPIGQGSFNMNGHAYFETGYSPESAVQDFTVSYWIKTNANSGVYAIVSSMINNPGGGLWLASNAEVSGAWSYNNGKYTRSNGAFDNNVWHHCVYKHTSDGTGQWYVDGVASGAVSVVGNHTISSLTIGNSYQGNTTWDTTQYGSICDYRFYATALSDADIKELYETRFSLSDNGTLFCNELVLEEENYALSTDNPCIIKGTNSANQCPTIYQLKCNWQDLIGKKMLLSFNYEYSSDSVFANTDTSTADANMGLSTTPWNRWVNFKGNAGTKGRASGAWTIPSSVGSSSILQARFDGFTGTCTISNLQLLIVDEYSEVSFDNSGILLSTNLTEDNDKMQIYSNEILIRELIER